MTCGETSGFLFSHECGREAAANCHLCGKSICSMHARTTEGQIFCITCLKRYLRERPAAAQAHTPEEQPAGTPEEQARRRSFGVSPWYMYDDPYWYTSRHYPSYHAHEFTSEDRTAFEATPEAAAAAGGAEEKFETEKEAS